MKTAYQAWIFDFDGTIADTLQKGVEVYNGLAPQYGLKEVSSEELPALREMSLGELMEYLGVAKHRLPKLLYHGTRALRESIAGLPLIQGMREVLSVLPKDVRHVGILTSNSVENVRLFLAAHGLDESFGFISSTSKLSGKARHLNSIRRSYRLELGEMLYIGDEIRDIRAARRAGVAMAAVSWGFNSHRALSKESPDYLFSQPGELLELNGLAAHDGVGG